MEKSALTPIGKKQGGSRCWVESHHLNCHRTVSTADIEAGSGGRKHCASVGRCCQSEVQTLGPSP